MYSHFCHQKNPSSGIWSCPFSIIASKTFPNGWYVIWSIRQWRHWTSIWESSKRPSIWEMNADLRIGRRLENGRRSESYIHIAYWLWNVNCIRWWCWNITTDERGVYLLKSDTIAFVIVFCFWSPPIVDYNVKGKVRSRCSVPVVSLTSMYKHWFVFFKIDTWVNMLCSEWQSIQKNEVKHAILYTLLVFL